MVNVFKGMAKVDKAEVSRAKAVLVNSLLTHLDRSADRLEEAAKNVIFLFFFILMNELFYFWKIMVYGNFYLFLGEYIQSSVSK